MKRPEKSDMKNLDLRSQKGRGVVREDVAHETSLSLIECKNAVENAVSEKVKDL